VWIFAIVEPAGRDFEELSSRAMPVLANENDLVWRRAGHDTNGAGMDNNLAFGFMASGFNHPVHSQLNHAAFEYNFLT
jgi:hypothetical protein